MNKLILIQGPMGTETAWLIENLRGRQEHIIYGYKFYEGTLSGVSVVISKTEIGMENTAAATAYGIQKFNPILIINQGTAGGHGNAHRGSIVIANSSINISSFVTNRENDEWTLGSYSDEEPEGTAPQIIQFDELLVEKAKLACQKFVDGEREVILGRIASGNIWNKYPPRIESMHREYHEVAEEMELYSAAKVANRAGIPVLGIRILSNNDGLGEPFENNELPRRLQQIVAGILPSLITP